MVKLTLCCSKSKSCKTTAKMATPASSTKRKNLRSMFTSPQNNGHVNPSAMPKNASSGCKGLSLMDGRRVTIFIEDGSKFTVPAFLVDAFNILDLHGLQTEGLFRKEGNSSRIKALWAPFLGHVGIPSACTPFDVCALIKRYLREIEEPILTYAIQDQFVLYGRDIANDDVRLKAVLEFCHVLPKQHTHALAFIMRQLNKLASLCDHNKMDSLALATVLAPTIFRDNKAVTTETMADMRELMAARAKIIKMLIDNAHQIGVLSEQEKCLSPNMYAGMFPEDDGYVPKSQLMKTSPQYAKRKPGLRMSKGKFDRNKDETSTKRKARSKSMHGTRVDHNGTDNETPLRGRRLGSKNEEKGETAQNSAMKAFSHFTRKMTNGGNREKAQRSSSQRTRHAKSVTSPPRPVDLLINGQERADMNGSISNTLSKSDHKLQKESGDVAVVKEGSGRKGGLKRYGSGSLSLDFEYESPRPAPDQVTIKVEEPIEDMDTNEEIIKNQPTVVIDELVETTGFRAQQRRPRSQRRLTSPIRKVTALKRGQPNSLQTGLHPYGHPTRNVMSRSVQNITQLLGECDVMSPVNSEPSPGPSTSKGGDISRESLSPMALRLSVSSRDSSMLTEPEENAIARQNQTTPKETVSSEAVELKKVDSDEFVNSEKIKSDILTFLRQKRKGMVLSRVHNFEALKEASVSPLREIDTSNNAPKSHKKVETPIDKAAPLPRPFNMVTRNRSRSMVVKSQSPSLKGPRGLKRLQSARSPRPTPGSPSIKAISSKFNFAAMEDNGEQF